MNLKSIAAIAVTTLAIGCAQVAQVGQTASGFLPQTPEAQIVAGAGALTAATTVAGTALRNDKITVSQAKSYRVMLGAASAALDQAHADLVKCRAATGSTPTTSPDPCRPGVVPVLQLALESIANIKRTIDAGK